MPESPGSVTAATSDETGRAEHRRILVILGALMLGMLLAALDQTIVATALPTIAGDLHGLNHLSWVVTAYILTATISTPLWGKLGDLYGRKQLFQAAIVIFLIGSALAGLSQNMAQLIGLRALQGVGAGGLMVGAQAIIGDIVSPRQRGRYMGYFGAVFGLSSVIGPLAGGFITQHLSWRWVFYINLPIGAVALAVIIAVLPTTKAVLQPKIDYWGIILLATVVTCIVLVTSLGGSQWDWGSAQVIGLIVLALACAVAFGFVETRVPEPVLPFRLFRNRVFSTTSVVGFVVGFAMFGSITYLPLYLQQIQGASPTESGLRMLPMMFGVLLTSVTSGQVISRTGRYRVFPITGCAVFTVGLYLLSRMDPGTSTLQASVFMFVLGAGIGMVMQVLVLAVQNAVDYGDLGTATSGATLFRSIGSSVGVAIFGTVFTAQLTHHLRIGTPAAAVGPCSSGSLTSSSAALPACPPAVQTWFVHAYTQAIQIVFLAAVPVGLLAFVLAWFIPEVKLRAAADRPDTGESFGLLCDRNAFEELRLLLWRSVGREDRLRAYTILAADAGLDLSPGQCWMVSRVASDGSRTIEAMAEASQTPQDVVNRVAFRLQDRGLLTLADGTATITATGDAAAQTLLATERAALRKIIDEWPGDKEPEVYELIDDIAQCLAEEAPPLTDVRS